MRKLFLLVSPAFLISVGLLLLNDHVLKAAYPNWITGKLSDFAGLFAFGIFFLVAFPARPRLVLAGIASFFVFWKSPLSQPLLDAWNNVAWFQMGRTVDYSDLVALVMLPLAKWIYDRSIPLSISPRLVAASAFFALFAFTATTRAPTPESEAEFARRYLTYNFGKSGPAFVVPLTRDKIYAQWELRGFRVSGSYGAYGHAALVLQNEVIGRKFPGKPRARFLSAQVKVDREGDATVVRLRSLVLAREPKDLSEADAVKLFESLMFGSAVAPPPYQPVPGKS